MTSYRFRVKFFYFDPTSLWRDIVGGAEWTIDEFKTVLNLAVGLDQDHLWFYGTNQDDWNSEVEDRRPCEIGQSTGGLCRDSDECAAGETTVGEMVQQLDLDETNRICYLTDFGDEWRFNGALNCVNEEESGDRQPEVVKEKGESVEQYAPKSNGRD